MPESGKSKNGSDRPLIAGDVLSAVDIEMGTLDGGAEKGGDVPLLGDSFSMGEGIYERHLDYTAVPAFNVLGRSDANHGVGDVGGSLRYFIELSHAGHAKFDKENWARMLHICRYDAFLSGEAVAQQEAIKDHINDYRRMRTAQKPWGNPALKALKAHWHHHLPELQEILVGAIKEANLDREKKQWPLRSIIFWGDILADRDSSCGDLAIVFGMYIAQQYDLPYTVMASNHGLRAIKLQQFLSALLGEKEDFNEQRSRWLDVFRTRAREEDEELLNDQDVGLARSALSSALRSHAINPDRLVSYFKDNINSDESRQSLRRLFNHMGSVPYDFLRGDEKELGEKLQQLLSMMPIGVSVMANVASHDIGILSDATSPIGQYIMHALKEKYSALPKEFYTFLHMDLSGKEQITPDLEKYIQARILETKSSVAMQDLFGGFDFSTYRKDATITEELNTAITEDIRKELSFQGSSTCYDCLNAIFVADRRAIEQPASCRPLMNPISREDLNRIVCETISQNESRKPEQYRMTQQKINEKSTRIEKALLAILKGEVSASVGSEEELNAISLQELFARFKWAKLNKYRLRTIRQCRVDQVKLLIAECDLKWLPVEDPAFMTALLSVKNREEVFTPIKTTQEQILVCAGSVLTQYLMFPDRFDASSTPLLTHVMPPLTSGELDVVYEGKKVTLNLKGRFVAKIKQGKGEELAQFMRRSVRYFKSLETKTHLPLMREGGEDRLPAPTENDFETRFLLEMVQFKYYKTVFREMYRSPDESPEAFKARVNQQLSLLQQGRASVENNEDVTAFIPMQDLTGLRSSSDEDQKVTTYTLDGRVVMREFRLMGEKAEKFQKRCSKIYKLLTTQGKHSTIEVPMEAFLGILTGKGLTLSIVPRIAELHLLPRVIHTVQKGDGEDRFDFNNRQKKELDALKASLNTGLLDSNGMVTKQVKARFSQMHEWYCAWRNNIMLFGRSGLSGNYITHAPLVGLQGETTDQSMVLHYLLPSAQILLKALNVNTEEEGNSKLKSEAKELFKQLKSIITVVPQSQEKIIHSPVIHLIIWQLMDVINRCFQFFLRHELIVTEETHHIPETHIGMLSRSPEAETWENVIINAKRHDVDVRIRRPGEPIVALEMRQGVGACMERNPLLLFVYPLLAAVVWSRANQFEYMSYPGYQLVPLEKQTYAHMGEPDSPFGQCIDMPPEHVQLRRYRETLESLGAPESEDSTQKPVFTVTKRYALVKPLPEWVRCYLHQQHTPRSYRQSTQSFVFDSKEAPLVAQARSYSLRHRSSHARSVILPTPRMISQSNAPQLLRNVWIHPEWFVPCLAKDLLGLILSNRPHRPSKQRAGTSATTYSLQESASEVPLYAVQLDLKQELNRCIDMLLKRFRKGGDQRIDVYGVIFEFLANAATDARVVASGLSDKIHVVLNDMPHPDAMTKRARYAFNVRAALRLSRMPHSAKLSEYMLPFYVLDPLCINAMTRLEMFAFYNNPENYSVSLSNMARADRFQDIVLHSSVVEEAKQDRKRQLPILKTTILQKVFGGIGVFTAFTYWLGHLIYIVSTANDNALTEDLINAVCDPLFFTIIPAVILTAYVFVEVRDKFPRKIRPCLDVISRIFPRLTGVSRHPFFVFFSRPFLASQTFSLGFRYVLLGLGAPLSSAPENQVNTTDLLNVTTPSSVNVTDTPALPALLDNLEYDYFLMSVAFALSIFGTILFVIEPGSIIAPGQQPRREVLTKFEGQLSKHLNKSLSFLESLSWVEMPLVIGVAFYCILVVSDIASPNEAAVIATGIMLAPLTLRLGAYPPKCASKCIRKVDEIDPIVEHSKKRVVRQISLILNTTLFVFFDYYLQGVFCASVAYRFNPNFDLFYFLKNIFEDSDKIMVFIGSLTLTAFQTIDNVLSLGRYFLSTGDLDKARGIRELAKRITKGQEQKEPSFDFSDRSILEMLRLHYIAEVNARRQASLKVNPQARLHFFVELEGQRGTPVVLDYIS